MADPTGLIERSVLSGNGRAKNADAHENLH